MKRPSVVVDLGNIPALREISATAAGLEIGAMAPLSEVVAHPGGGGRLWVAGVGVGAGGVPADPESRDAGREREPGHAVLVLPGRVELLPGGGQHLLRGYADGDEPGALCAGASRCVAVNPSDTAPALIALDAQMVVRSGSGERVVDAADFLWAPRWTLNG